METTVKTLIIEALSNDFEIEQEVDGVHIIEKDKVRIDLLIHPKPHLLDEGFHNSWIGVEIKYFDRPEEQIGKVARFFWQAITYQQSIYRLNGIDVRPQFVLLASNIQDVPPSKPGGFSMYRSMLQVGNLAMVGHLKVFNSDNWDIRFVSSGYMEKKNGIFKKTKSNAGCGKYIGNSSRKRKY